MRWFVMMTQKESERCIRDLRDAIGSRLATEMAPDDRAPDRLLDLLRQLKHMDETAAGDRNR